MPVLSVHLPFKPVYLPLVAPGGTHNMERVTYTPASLQYPGDVADIPDQAPLSRLTRAKLTEPVKVKFPNPPDNTVIEFPRNSFVYVVKNPDGTPDHVMLQTRPEMPMQPWVLPQGGRRRRSRRNRCTRRARRTSTRRYRK